MSHTVFSTRTFSDPPHKLTGNKKDNEDEVKENEDRIMKPIWSKKLKGRRNGVKVEEEEDENLGCHGRGSRTVECLNVRSKQVDEKEKDYEIYLTPCKSSGGRASSGYKQRINCGSNSRRGFKFLTAVGSKPHPEKGNEGEDAFFVSGDGKTLGIADGVGGWSDLGVDAGEYSRMFMRKCHQLSLPSMDAAEPEAEIQGDGLSMMQPENVNLVEPRRMPETMIKEAYEDVELSGSRGSTTCCVITLQEERNVLRAANLGDSGFILIRRLYKQTETVISSPICDHLENKENRQHDANRPRRTRGASQTTTADADTVPCLAEDSYTWRIVFRSNEQQHYFNCPRQLGTDSIDKPSDCDRYGVNFVPNDLVLLATDGLLDNLSLKDISEIVNTIDRKHFRSHGQRKSATTGKASVLQPRPIRRILESDEIGRIGSLPLSPKKRQKCGEAFSGSSKPGYNRSNYMLQAESISTTAEEERNEQFLNELATELTKEAYMASIDTTRVTPFEKNAMLNGIHYKGGKMDDITVAVAQIVPIHDREEHEPVPSRNRCQTRSLRSPLQPLTVRSTLNFDAV